MAWEICETCDNLYQRHDDGGKRDRCKRCNTGVEVISKALSPVSKKVPLIPLLLWRLQLTFRMFVQSLR